MIEPRQVFVQPRRTEPPPPSLLKYVNPFPIVVGTIFLSTTFFFPEGRIPLAGMAFQRFSLAIDPLYRVADESARKVVFAIQKTMLAASCGMFAYFLFTRK